jgi:hypothetical protein
VGKREKATTTVLCPSILNQGVDTTHYDLNDAVSLQIPDSRFSSKRWSKKVQRSTCGMLNRWKSTNKLRRHVVVSEVFLTEADQLSFHPVLSKRTPLSLVSADLHQTGVHQAIVQAGKQVSCKFATKNQTS